MADQLTQQVAEVLRDQWVPSTVVYGVDEPVGFESVRDWAEYVAEAVVAALKLPVLWGVAIRWDDGTYDVNANTFYSKAEAVQRLRSLSELYPDDRRCLVQRFGPSPWVRVPGEEPQ